MQHLYPDHKNEQTPSASLTIKAPKKFVGESMQSLNLFKKHHVYCIGIEKNNQIIPMDPEQTIQEGERLIIAGYNKDLEKISKL